VGGGSSQSLLTHYSTVEQDPTNTTIRNQYFNPRLDDPAVYQEQKYIDISFDIISGYEDSLLHLWCNDMIKKRWRNAAER